MYPASARQGELDAAKATIRRHESTIETLKIELHVANNTIGTLRKEIKDRATD